MHRENRAREASCTVLIDDTVQSEVGDEEVSYDQPITPPLALRMSRSLGVSAGGLVTVRDAFVGGPGPRPHEPSRRWQRIFQHLCRSLAFFRPLSKESSDNNHACSRGARLLRVPFDLFLWEGASTLESDYSTFVEYAIVPVLIHVVEHT